MVSSVKKRTAKRVAKCLLLGLVVVANSAVYAGEQLKHYPIADALMREQSKSKLGSLVKFYFAGQDTAKTLQRFGPVATNKKTNAFNKSDLEACQSVFLSALIAFKERAKREGANAVINIQSSEKNVNNPTTFECHLGKFVASVALRGEVVRLID